MDQCKTKYCRAAIDGLLYEANPQQQGIFPLTGQEDFLEDLRLMARRSDRDHQVEVCEQSHTIYPRRLIEGGRETREPCPVCRSLTTLEWALLETAQPAPGWEPGT